MHYIIYPEKDASIYSEFPTYNYGLDEILEIRKIDAGAGYTYSSSALIKFNMNDFSLVATASAMKFYLNLYAANPLELSADYTLYAYPVSSSWINGTGFTSAAIQKQDGVSWSTRTKSIGWQNSGSDYITNSVSASQLFSYDTPDVRMDVTNLVRAWISGSLENNGIIVKFAANEQNGTENYGRLTFYSKETHTVNLPTLEAVWDDSIFITGSTQFITSGSIRAIIDAGAAISSSITGSSYSSSNFSGSVYGQTIAATIVSGSITNYLAGSSFEPIESDQINIVFKNLKKEYKYQSTVRFRIIGKDLYQRKTFLNTNATSFNIIKYLPQNQTYYSIVDAYTGRIIIPFDDYTKVSCGLNGNYFDVNLNGFMPERFYRMIFKVVFDGIDTYFDKNYIFKVTK